MTGVRPPTAAEETALRTLLRAEARRLLTDEDLEHLGREAITRINAQIRNGAPAATGTPPHCTTNGWKEPKAMPSIIQRHARDLHAGDVITRDPDHDRPVRWRVTRPPVRTGDGEYALADYTDLDTGGHGIAYYRVLTELAVEPAGGAA